MSEARTAKISRKTAETDITLSLSVDGTGKSSIDTGVPFFDHMLTLFAKHGLFDLEVECDGDVHVDYHHTVEDVGIVLGQAFKQALGDKAGIVRYGFFFLPMDETLARVAVDLSGRSFLEHRVPENVTSIRDFSFTLVEEFFRAFTFNIDANVHAQIEYGRDAHHMAEALFKGLARSVDAATQIDPRSEGSIPSTKGTI